MDNVKHPSHYCKGGMECIDAIKAVVSTITDPFEAYCTGNIIKYVWRWNSKNGIEDLRKAIQYINFIERHRSANPITESIKTCSTCIYSRYGFFNPFLMFCGNGEYRAIKPDGTCAKWKYKEETNAEK